MPTYFYTISKGGYNGERRYIQASDENGIYLTIIKYELECKKKKRFDKLLKDFTGDVTNSEEIEEYLPLPYKKYAYNMDKLKNKMCSIYEILHKYTINDIELAPDCYGCLHDSPGQRDHMECPTGCLHSKYTCSYC